jgi:hypothetical protein
MSLVALVGRDAKGGDKIPEFLVLHPIDLDIELDELIVGIAVKDCDVMARTCRAGPQLRTCLRLFVCRPLAVRLRPLKSHSGRTDH